jgi:hypothetical protein
MKLKVSLDDFSVLNEIPLEINPNYNFDTTIGEDTFTVSVRTFLGGQTRISIFLGDEVVCENAPVGIYGANLAFYSTYQKGAFFFLRNSAMSVEPNFLNFSSNDLRLLHGYF